MEGLQYYLSDINGRLLESGELENAHIDLRSSGLQAGSYILHLKGEDYVRTYPLILR